MGRPGIGACPLGCEGPVARPGCICTFDLGGAYLGTKSVLVKIYLDYFRAIVEERIDNNSSRKQFGSH